MKMARRAGSSSQLHRVNEVHVYNSGLVAQWLGRCIRGREFDSRPVRYQVTTLAKLFTPVRACVGARGLVVGFDS